MRGYVVEIIEARLEEIFEHVNSELKKIKRDGKLPAGIVLTGGGANLPGTVEFSKKHLRLPATSGTPQNNITTIIDRIDDPAFATATGLVLWGGKFSSPSGNLELSGMMKKLLNNPGVEKMRKWLKSFIP